MLTAVEQILAGALPILPSLLANMAAVLVAALLSVVAVSFFKEGPRFSQLPPSCSSSFITGTNNPILGLAGGIVLVARAQRKGEFDQRELAVLFTLVFFAIAYYYGLVRIPEFTLG